MLCFSYPHFDYSNTCLFETQILLYEGSVLRKYFNANTAIRVKMSIRKRNNKKLQAISSFR